MKRLLAMLMVLVLLVANVPAVAVEAVGEDWENVYLTDISVKTLPNKTEYMRGEELDTTGLTLTLLYSDGTVKDITEGFYIDWFDLWMPGTQTIYVEYEGHRTSFEVMVIAPVGLSVKNFPERTEYFRGEYLDTKGLVLTVTYSDGTTKDITDGYYIDWFDSFMIGVQMVSVRYEDLMTELAITIVNGGYCGDNLYWELDEATGVLTISGNGAMSDWNNPWNEYRYSIKSVVIEEGVTNIGSNAFMDCYEMTEITIPESVTYIGENAFSNCSNLTAVRIPNGVQSIGSYAFSYCSNLADITVSDSVNYIGDNAFYDCTSLAEIDLSGNITHIGYGAFYGSGLTHITIPENVTYIDSQTFANCANLASIAIPQNMMGIGWDAFYNCTGLTTVNYQGYEENKTDIMIDSGNDNILNANWIYREGAERTGIVIENLPDKTEYWVNEEFYIGGLTVAVTYSDGVKLDIWEGFTVSDVDTSTAGTKTVTVTYKDLTTTFTVIVKDKTGACGENATWTLSEAGVLTISGTGAMDNWGNGVMAPWYQWSGSITTLVIQDGITGLGAFAFYGCYGLTEVPIPDSVTVLGDYAFSGCRSLSAIEIPKGVTSIGTCAFSACTSLAEITIPDGITNLSYGMFEYCPMLTEITIPASVTSIGDYAFSNCGRLATVHFQGDQKQMLEITIGKNNESLMSASWNCNTQEGDPEITGIGIKTLPAKTEYMLYENLDTTGLVLTVQFSDGSQVEITGGFAISGFDSSLTGSQMLTVSYGGFTDCFDIKIIKGGTFSDTLVWVLDDNGVLTIFGTGAMYDYNNPWRDWSYEIRSVVIEDGVTRIGADAFSWCEYISEITIPASVISIGYSAFEGCYSLYTVNYGGTRNQSKEIDIAEWNDYLTQATWVYPTVAVHQQGNTQRQYDSLEEALAAATYGTVSLCMDVTEKTVVVNPGVTLDLNGYTLTADLVVGLNGAVITDGGENCIGGGLVKTGRYTLVYAPGNDQPIIPVWNGVNGYIFTKVTVLELTQPTGVEGTASYMFLPRFSNSEAAALLSDGGLNNGLKFKVCMTWADGKSQMFYTYSDDLVAQVYDGTGRLAFSLTITGIADIADAVVTAEIVTDSGATASSKGLGI